MSRNPETESPLPATPPPFDSVSSLVQAFKALDPYSIERPPPLRDSAGRYAWLSLYHLRAYAFLYDITHDTAWLDPMTAHLDAFLAQRDVLTGLQDYRGRLAPAWQEKTSRYVWNGFTGALGWVLLSHVDLVDRYPQLSSRRAPDGRTHADKARTYANAVEEALRFHDDDWRETGETGHYIFAADMPFPDVAGQIAAYDMNSLMALAHLALAVHHRKAGRSGPSAFHRDRARRDAVLFRRVCSAHTGADGQPYYLWPFADYYERHADDVGHANYNVLFAIACRRENMVFTDADMEAFRGTFRRILTEDGRVPHRMIDGTDLDNVSDCVHYWHLLDVDDPALLARSFAYYSRNRDSILDLVTIGVVLHSLGRLAG